MIRQLTVSIVILCLVSATPAFAGAFRDDFENEQDFIEDKQLREGGVWGEDIGQYTWEEGAIKGTPGNQEFSWLLITGDYVWEDYTVECKIKLLANQGSAGVVARRPCINCNPCYSFDLDPSADQVAIYQEANVLDSSPFTPEVDRWYSLKAVVEGSHLEFYVDGELLVEAEDTTHPEGKGGFCVWKITALFDDFVMTGPEVEDGGHWDPAKHPEEKAVMPSGKLAATWGTLKQRF